MLTMKCKIPGYDFFRTDRVFYQRIPGASIQEMAVCVCVSKTIFMQLLSAHLLPWTHKACDCLNSIKTFTPISTCQLRLRILPSIFSCQFLILDDAVKGLESNDLVLLGDFSVNMLSIAEHGYRNFTAFMAPFRLRKTISASTRTTDKSRPFIDLIFTNCDCHMESHDE